MKHELKIKVMNFVVKSTTKHNTPLRFSSIDMISSVFCMNDEAMNALIPTMSIATFIL